ncbi:pyruvate phosphate dikinase PEP/pyruvate- binding [Desulfofarcimen acetoxidans DSM 771]|uniref:Pyruvate phosphate dikinase PEP/pyruvate-binding n=1 Tax=Desulfofarcimen acetoxidans (strain ATCC 49208 / DSM 771 / KCTC 5769 / VKM B-1644 / 5575) TaxID=485916 RepID=C8VXF2_DESAS|nr:PEP/pyruvate-binding domain-containing protein [Desulfofarcimen acetoxidans]ACV64548.1 pyruvate phosphate dikinase PEP/pyruvate- binding [Desulfofarcimen acetoxidans DSM 771]
MKNSGTKCILNWSEVFHLGTRHAGGKGWNLGRLARYGFNIPPGGILTTRAYAEFINLNKLQEQVQDIAASVTAANINETYSRDILTDLRNKIRRGAVPQHVVSEITNLIKEPELADKSLAVRSSAAAEDSVQASFAGIHESFLNVSGLDNILAAIKECYASLWSPRAVAYRRKINISDDDSAMAVVIMSMVEAHAAGVGFTCDPRSGQQDVLVISANFGLGESVVNGVVEPDTYYLNAQPWEAVPGLIERKTGRKEGVTINKKDGGTQFIHNEQLSGQPVLSNEEVEKLGLLLLRVLYALGDGEQHQDVEWVFDGREFVLVQARPVTSLPRNTFPALKGQPDIWSNGNYRDAVPMVQSPLNRRLCIDIIDTIHEASYTRIGYQLPKGLRFSRYFNGRLYANISVLQWAWYDSMGILPRDVNSFWGGHQPEIDIKETEPYQGDAGAKRLERLQKNALLIDKAMEDAPKTFSHVLHRVNILTEKGFEQRQGTEIINAYNELARLAKEYAREFRFLSGTGASAVGSLFTVLNQYLGHRAAMVFNALMVGSEVGITSADHGYRLVELASLARRDNDAVRFFNIADFRLLKWEEQLPEESPFKQSFRQFLNDYGHRAVYELDIRNPRWQEDPTYLLDIIRGSIDTADIGEIRTKQKEKYERVWEEIKDKVPVSEHYSIEKWVKEAQAGAAVREMAKSILVKVTNVCRIMALELGSRFYLKGIIEKQADIFFCTWPELFSVLTGAWDGIGLKVLIVERKSLMSKMESISPPDIIFGETPRYTEPVTLNLDSGLQGVAVAAGKASGTVRLINNPVEGSKLQSGDVLVAPSTDPAWTPLFLKACAVVMETGGFMSHGAIVAREYGIPAVVNIPGVMKVVKDGQKITVDGDEGRVFIP